MLKAATETAPSGRDALSRQDFESIRKLAYDKFGLDLKAGKEELVAPRLGKKLREHRFTSFKDYYRHVVEDSTGMALIGLIDALTTNHTSFVREPAHFDFLRQVIVPALSKRSKIEVWSAACSTGEEPYTIACMLLDAGIEPSRLRILATDISTKVLQTARQAVYPAERLAEVPDSWRRNYLMRGTGKWDGWYRMRPEVRQIVEFSRVNLVEPIQGIPMFPVVFCRNVMIYFDKATQERVVGQLGSHLEAGGWLMVGHAESLSGVQHGLRYVRPATYRKPESEARR